MRTGIYEVMFIVRPDLDDEKIKSRIEKIKNLLVTKGAVIEKEEIIGRRIMETEFKHFKDGFYVLLYFSCEKEAVREITNVLRISDDIIRYLIVCAQRRPEKEPVTAVAQTEANV
jgi:small subunit ribosomal protein S6